MSKKRKLTPVLAPAFALDAPLVQAGHAEIFDQISGRNDGPVYNVAACPLEAEVWLMRTYRADPFRLVMRLGSDWFELARVRADDPVVRDLFEAGHILEYGPSPAQIASQHAREAEEQERREAEEAHKRARKEHRMHLQAQAEARELRAREERQAGM